jgi:hypothetical protein
LADAPQSALGPGRPIEARRAQIEACEQQLRAAAESALGREMAAACCAALWLRFDFLDRSHAISQELDSLEGSYWHGILHRREPDADNARYWFRRVGRHPIFSSLTAAARERVAAHLPLKPDRYLADAREWDPMRFIDLCEQARGTGSPLEAFCRDVQQVEWELLFERCWREISG